MAISRTLDEKRRETLRRQLYGKEVMKPKSQVSSVKDQAETKHTFSYKNPDSTTTTVSSTYLKQDLLKIIILSAIAVAIQLSLYFAINNNLVKLPI